MAEGERDAQTGLNRLNPGVPSDLMYCKCEMCMGKMIAAYSPSERKFYTVCEKCHRLCPMDNDVEISFLT